MRVGHLGLLRAPCRVAPSRRRPADASQIGPSPNKCLLCCFWDSRECCLMSSSHKATPSPAPYTLSAPEARIDRSRERLRRALVHLLYDSARPHVAKETHEKLEELGWDTAPHTAYSSDLALSDYHLFRPLKAFLAEKIFTK
ncbi:hypothetical protein RB195_023192 [Necator americanus]|uniref:Mos1 transposase HTH domain-containing protein n=1 Tax=Necator americanus TaxID=51031 RepID=A0ABR1EI73_NECAM